MSFGRGIRGDVVQADQPSWSSLEAVLGGELPSWFMWMYQVRLQDGTRIDAYKHVTTRRYLHLASDLCAFVFQVDGLYRTTDLATAIAATFQGWERAEPSERHRRRLSAVVASARDVAA